MDMRRICLVMGLLLCVVTPALAQKRSPCSKVLNDKQVKRESVETARLSPNGDDFVEEPRVITAITNYETDSSQLEKLTFDLNGNLILREINTCNPEGRRTGSIAYNADGSVKYRTVVATDTQITKESVSQTTKETWFNGDGSLRHQDDVDFINGRAVERRVYSPLSRFPGKHVLIKATDQREDWDILRPDGSLAAKLVIEDGGIEVRHELFEYHKQGALAKRSVEINRRDLRGREKAEYDGKGKLLTSEATENTVNAEDYVIKSLKRRWNSATEKMEPVSISYRAVEYFKE